MGNNKIQKRSLRLDRHILNVVIDTFSYMITNYDITGVIDHAAWIIQKSELEAMVFKFKPYAELDQKLAIIPIDEKDYNIYVRLVDYAGHAAPKQEDRALLETLYDAYMDQENDRNSIYLVATLDRDILSTVITVFNKMIDYPEAIDGSMYDLTPWPKFEALVEKFKNLLKNKDSQVIIPMTFSEWATYSSYSGHASDLGDDLTPEEEDIMIAADYEIYKMLPKPGGS